MELLFLLLMITTQIQQSESANCTTGNCNNQSVVNNSMDSMVTATEPDRCLEVVNSCLPNRTSISPTTTTINVCLSQIKFITIISTHTQQVCSQTTIPLPTTSSSQETPLMTPMASTVTVYITRSSDSTSPPTTRFALSNAAQIGILVTSGVLMCLPILAALVIVTYCWIRTHKMLKKKRNDSEIRFKHSVQDSIPSRRKNISEAAPLSVNSNPAYAARKPLQKNIAYEDTTLTTVTNSDPQEKEPQQLTNTQVSAYEIVPLASCQSASTNAHSLKN